jgi:hypothetical protein
MSERRTEADSVASALQVLRERPVLCSTNSNAPSPVQDSTCTVILAFSDTGPHKYYLPCYALRPLLALYSTLSLLSASSQTKSSNTDVVPLYDIPKLKLSENSAFANYPIIHVLLKKTIFLTSQQKCE